MSQPPRAFRVYTLTIRLVGLAIFLTALIKEFERPHIADDFLVLAVFFFLILLAELWPIKFPGSHVEYVLTMPVVVGLFLSRGPTSTMAVFYSSMFLANVIMQHKRPWRWLLNLVSYNAAVYVISFAGGSLIYLLTGGKTLAQGGEVTLWQMAIPLFLWVAACTTVNMLLNSAGVSLYFREPWRVRILRDLPWYAPNYLITGPSGILFAYLFSKFDVAGVLLVLIPILVGRHTLSQYAVELDAYRETITTLGTYMQHYHPYTKGHLERVADLSEEIAMEMHLPPQSLRWIRDAGLLHDIGKVGVDEEVLDKVGKLTDEEWGIIKQHPARGADILSQMKYLKAIVPWVRGHHERPDGRGYPDGLMTGIIPVEAAVIAVADAFDAMTGGPDEKDQRVYRIPLTLDQAMDQVRYGAGTQFDARVVKAFMRVMARRETRQNE